MLLGLLPAAGWAEVVDRVVAVVGKDIITMSDVKAFKAQRTRNSPNSKDPLEALIREKLLKAEMERLSINVAEDEINGMVNDVLKRNKITLEVLKAELARKGMSFDQYKKDISGQIKQMKFLSQVIFPRIRLTEDDVNRKAGPKASEEGRMKARMELMQAKSSEELVRYLDEARAKTYVEIKK